MAPSDNLIEAVLKQYNLSLRDFKISPVGSGYIHLTFKLAGTKDLILQRVNKNVFTQPELIASNLKAASDHIVKTHPEYLFLTAFTTTDGKQMAYDEDGYPWRIFPFFENTFTIDKVDTTEQAYSAAAEFARMIRYLDDADVTLFKPTIDRFQDLTWRYQQFEDSLVKPVVGRKEIADELIEKAKRYHRLVDEYRTLINSGAMKIRVTHNDTKINNILFDEKTHGAVCAIDLDTLMPGYVMYDIGDMIRTFVSPVAEEERDLDKVFLREEIYTAIVKGYLSQMGERLSKVEIETIPFAGMMMTYIMALRMLTDYLNGDVYYTIRYADQNLVRARNQFKLLDVLNTHRETNRALKIGA
jgi:Ser/Thr protein kinase RdoA (MazF antagonist)